MQPGETIQPGATPGGAAPAPPITSPSQSVPGPDPGPSPVPSPNPDPVPAPDAPPAPEPVPSPEPQPIPAGGDSISWTASEFMIHQKSANWYLLLGLGTVAAAGIVWLVTRDKVSVVVVGIVGVVFGIAASRQPRTLDYSLDEHGLRMGSKNYPYSEFKSFSIMDEGPIHSIMLLPLKRFMPGVSIYYPPEQEDAISNVLALYLPHEERQPDLVDRLMHKVRY